ncbi:MAG: helix-turn-helix transcriptional regulator [Lachnospiraceae bacterium]|nr:helix-turn-helix transcriptional regulator [Lachnospiraceae bacterium]
MISGLAQRLQEQRTNANLSQKQVADAIGVAPSLISNYENESRVPSLDKLKALAHLYKCSTDYLLGLDKTPIQTLDVSMLNDEQRRLLQYFLQSIK